MQRSFPASSIASGLVELELQNPREEIARVRRVARDVIFGARIEGIGGALDRRRDALILQAQLVPGRRIVCRLDITGEDAPAPLVDQQAERQEGNLVHCLPQQQAEVLVGSGHFGLVKQADLHEIFWRNRERDRIADCLVEPVIGAILEQEALVLVGALIIVVAELVVDGGEVVAIHLDAHLDANIVLGIDIPGTGVANDFAVRRFGEQRPFVEGLWQRLKTERREKAFAGIDHLQRIIALCLEQFGGVITDIPCPCRCDDIINIAPFLGPHIAEQIGADRAGCRLHLVAIFLVQLFAGVAVQLVVERLDLRPQLVGQLGEIIGGHVITGAPHCADIGEAQFACAFIGDVDHAGIVVFHRRADIGVPAFPHLGELVRIAVGAHCGLNVRAVDRLAIQRALALAVSGVELGRDLVEFGGSTVSRRRRQHDAAAQLVELAGIGGIKPGDAREPGGIDRRLYRHGRALGPDLGCHRISIIGDIGAVDPVDPAGIGVEFGHFIFGLGNKLTRIGSGRLGGRFHLVLLLCECRG